MCKDFEQLKGNCSLQEINDAYNPFERLLAVYILRRFGKAGSSQEDMLQQAFSDIDLAESIRKSQAENGRIQMHVDCECQKRAYQCAHLVARLSNPHDFEQFLMQNNGNG